jgi:glyoxylase-like metal-dependent hydrolase (beta-lactamase superfamily II)
MRIEGFFDQTTWTVSYLVIDAVSRKCAVVDSVLDYDPKSGRTSTGSADLLVARIRELGLTVEWILETHVHADHFTASDYLKETTGGKTAVGSQITQIQNVFGGLFNAGDEFARDGSQFDKLLADDEVLNVGQLEIRAWHTPGHTPACVTYVVSDGSETAALVGDTLFMPDYGTARCDFPGGDPLVLYRSIQRVLSLPDETKLYMCHDYQPGGRDVQFISTVAEERASNIHVGMGITEDEFVAMRTQRDATLDMPVLLLPSVQVNMRAGGLPEPEANGVRYIKIPLNAL